MFDFSVSWMPLLTVAVANFFGSWLYYSPMSPFFRIWQKNLGFNPDNREMTPEQKKAMPRMMIGAVVATTLFAYGLMFLVNNLGVSTFVDGASLGLVVWLAFVVSHSLNTQFEGRKPAVLVVNNIWYLLTYALFGGLLAVWR